MYIRDLIKLIKPVKSNLVILNLSYDSYTRFKKLQGVKFHLPLHFRNDSEVNLEESKREFIKMMQSHRDILVNSNFVEVNYIPFHVDLDLSDLDSQSEAPAELRFVKRPELTQWYSWRCYYWGR